MTDRPRHPAYSTLVGALPAVTPFVPPEALERQAGRPLALRIGANESSFGASPGVLAAMREAAAGAAYYGDPEMFVLREAIARHHAVHRDNVAVGPGVDALLGLLVRTYLDPGDPVVMSAGGYPTFAFHVRGYGGRFETTPYRDDANDLDALLALAQTVRPKLLYLSNPDNPTGSWVSGPAQERLIAGLPPGTLLILDEAYGEFAPSGTLPDLDAEHPQVIRLRTFSKAYGLAGMRIGYLVGPAHLVQALDKIRDHFAVGGVAQSAALAALADQDHIARVVAAVAEGRRDYQRIAARHGFRALPSATNFVAIDVGTPERARGILSRLLHQEGVFIRMPGTPPIDRLIRVTVGTAPERARLRTRLRRRTGDGFGLSPRLRPAHRPRPTVSRGRIVLLHCVAGMPLAGIAWQAIHHLVGFRRLGYDVWYVEDNGAAPYHPVEDRVIRDSAYGVAFLRRVMAAHGFADRWAYWDGETDLWHGLPAARVGALYAEADLLVNLCGTTRLRQEHAACGIRLYVDTDPFYEQVRYASGDPLARSYLDDHTHHATYGTTIGTPALGVALDTAPLRWRPTRPPVVLSLWPATPPPEPARFTTVATWENQGKTISFGGETYHWSKHRNFERFLDLPRRSGFPFTMAMRPPTTAVAAAVRPPAGRSPIRCRSREASPATGGSSRARGGIHRRQGHLRRPNTGWFSDRSVCYLASGRPVVTQRTGADHPMGEGLFDYADMVEAEAAVAAIAADYPRHARAARGIAEGFFDSDAVLAQLLAL